MKDNDLPRDWARMLGYLTVILGDLVGFTGAGIGLGYLAWRKLGAPWWVLLTASLIGLTISMFRLYQLTQKDVK